ncbi:MAG: FAD-dependent oxidoreductase, partial [Candidatus Hydrogenedentales bacterium]
FVVPNYDWWEAPFYGIGLRVYDLLAGRHGFGKSRHISKEATIERIPTIETEGLRGGVIYYDGQFDDARLAINLAQTAADHGAALLNYARVVKFRKSGELIDGAVLHDVEGGNEFAVQARVVVNATGVFTDSVRRLDDADAPPMVSPSQGIHFVLDRSFLPGDTAIMVPQTDDGRVLFAIPWHDRVVLGTTDTPVAEAVLEPRPLQEELDYLFKHAASYLSKDPGPEDVLSVFAGLRPLVKAGNGINTAALSRDHTIVVSPSGLVTVTGGKWTTYRKMAEDGVDQAAMVGQLPERECVTKRLRIHGAHDNGAELGVLADYGSDAIHMQQLAEGDASRLAPLHPNLRITPAHVAWAAREEMARTVEDVLARRTRCLILDARASMEIAPRVAELLAAELGRDAAWAAGQAAEYRQLAAQYLLN